VSGPFSDTPSPSLSGRLRQYYTEILFAHANDPAVDALVRPPCILILICARPARVGGRTILVDCRDVYDDIAADDPAMLAIRLVHIGRTCGAVCSSDTGTMQVPTAGRAAAWSGMRGCLLKDSPCGAARTDARTRCNL
jgi:hypothetical protein